MPCGSSAASGMRSYARASSYDTKPTAPPDKRGRPATGSRWKRDIYERSDASGSGAASSRTAPPSAMDTRPARKVSAARGAMPMNEKRPMRSPPSADSSRNAPPSARSFANAETGVSRSARRSRTMGTNRIALIDWSASTATCSAPFLRRKSKRPSHPRSGRGSWCHRNLPAPLLASPAAASTFMERPLITEGFRTGPLAHVFGRSSRGIHSRLPAPPGSHPLRFAAGSRWPIRSRSNDVDRIVVQIGRFSTGANPRSDAEGPSVHLERQRSTRPRPPARPHGRPHDPEAAPAGEGPRDPARAAAGHRLPGDGEAAALPDRAAPPGVHLLGRAGDGAPGAGAVPSVPRAGRPRRAGRPERAVPDPPRRHPLPLSPRVLPLVALPHARLGRVSGDRLRSLRLRQLPPPRHRPAAGAARAGAARRLGALRVRLEPLERDQGQLQRGDDEQVVAADERVHLAERCRDLRSNPYVARLRGLHRVDDAVGGQLREKTRAVVQPLVVRGVAAAKQREALVDVLPQVDPLGHRAGVAHDVARGPCLRGRIVVGVDRE